jgi:hypothetical protein
MGYNNLCVGLDEPPAAFVALPLLVLAAYFGIRYAYLDTQRRRHIPLSDPPVPPHPVHQSLSAQPVVRLLAPESFPHCS